MSTPARSRPGRSGRSCGPRADGLGWGRAGGPTRLTLEITESTATEHADGHEVIVHALRERGVRVAIDDFRTGHASLARLHQRAMTILRIDPSFIRDLPGDVPRCS